MRVLKRMFIIILLLVFCGLSYEMVWRIRKTETEQEVFKILAESVHERKAEEDFESQVCQMDECSDVGMELEIREEFKVLAEENPDFRGWIQIHGTNIDYPVMKREHEREYYLHRDFYGNESYSGTPFITHGGSDPLSPVLIICGHHMKNGSMFSDLLKYQDPGFADEHDIIQFDTLYHSYRFQVVASRYLQDAEEDKNGFQISECMLEDDGTFLMLVTCSYEKEDGRYAVIGQLQNEER